MRGKDVHAKLYSRSGDKASRKRLCSLILIVCFVVCSPEQFEMQETKCKLRAGSSLLTLLPDPPKSSHPTAESVFRTPRIFFLKYEY